MTARKSQEEYDGKDPGDGIHPDGENGIREKQDVLPLWLVLIAAVLIAWGIWYTITYWSPPA